MGTADFFETAFEKRNKAHGAGNNDGDFRERFAEKVKRFVSGHNFAEAFTPEHNAADCDGKSDTVKKRFERDRVAVKEEKSIAPQSAETVSTGFCKNAEMRMTERKYKNSVSGLYEPNAFILRSPLPPIRTRRLRRGRRCISILCSDRL